MIAIMRNVNYVVACCYLSKLHMKKIDSLWSPFADCQKNRKVELKQIIPRKKYACAEWVEWSKMAWCTSNERMHHSPIKQLKIQSTYMYQSEATQEPWCKERLQTWSKTKSTKECQVSWGSKEIRGLHSSWGSFIYTGFYFYQSSWKSSQEKQHIYKGKWGQETRSQISKGSLQWNPHDLHEGC